MLNNTTGFQAGDRVTYVGKHPDISDAAKIGKTGTVLRINNSQSVYVEWDSGVPSGHFPANLEKNTVTTAGLLVGDRVKYTNVDGYGTDSLKGRIGTIKEIETGVISNKPLVGRVQWDNDFSTRRHSIRYLSKVNPAPVAKTVAATELPGDTLRKLADDADKRSEYLSDLADTLRDAAKLADKLSA